MKETKEETIELPTNISSVKITAPRDLAIVGQPKIGKGTIMGKFTEKYNALVWDLEEGGYEYIPARKMSIYNSNEDGLGQAYQNYLKQRKLLLENKGKYEYLIIDNLTQLDELSIIGGTNAYMNTIIGKKFNREGGIETGRKYEFGELEWKSVLTLPDGAGYFSTRSWFLQQLDFFKQISPYRIYIAHVVDKYIKDNGKEEVVGAEIFLTGKLKLIFASKVTALAKLIADDNERYLNFDVLNDSIIAGSRSPALFGKILVSKKESTGEINTFWENIYNN